MAVRSFVLIFFVFVFFFLVNFQNQGFDGKRGFLVKLQYELLWSFIVQLNM